MSSAHPFWTGKVALITGGSAGLGRELASVFCRRGAKVVIAARRQDVLDRTAKALRSSGSEVLAVAADVTSDEQVAALVARTIEHFGRLDVLVNNAGKSSRRAILDATPDEFRELLDINLLSAVRCTQAAASHLLAQRGHVVNIGSLASKAASRYLGAYPAAKFALAAYSQQLRLELGDQGLHVLLVCPGPLRRDETRTYGAEADRNLPPEASRPGGGVKTRLIDPANLATRIVTACERRKPELVIPAKARLLFAAGQLFPKLGDWLVKKLT